MGRASTEQEELLAELREAWKLWVCTAVSPMGRTFARGCWFGENVPGIDPCEHGPRGIEGAHWIKRQRVENALDALLPWGGMLPCPRCVPGDAANECEWCEGGLIFWPNEDRRDVILLAAWDPRNGVPACEKHHRRFDGHRVDARNELVIWRHEVPAHVEAFALDWGLEQALEDRHPPLNTGGI